MIIEKHKDDIMALLAEKGALGVNAIAKELDLSLSALQRYLHKQSYFKINEDRKWDLPERVVEDIQSNTLELMANLVETNILLIQSQMAEVSQSLNNIISPINTLKRGIDSYKIPSVADVPNKQPKHTKLDRLHTFVSALQKAVRDKMPDMSEEYRDMFKNWDIYSFVLEYGFIYMNSDESRPLTEFILGKGTELPENMLNKVKEHQK